jgi:hypothetical protein
MKLSEVLKYYFSSLWGIVSTSLIVLGCVVAGVAGVPVVAATGCGALLLIAAFAFSLKNGARAVVGEKERLTFEKNRKRLEDAKTVCQKLKNTRLRDEAAKKQLARLCYEADAYIAGRLESPDCIYDPRAIDALSQARAAIDAFLHAENDAQAEAHLAGSGAAGRASDSAADVSSNTPSSGAPNVAAREVLLESLSETIAALKNAAM